MPVDDLRNIIRTGHVAALRAMVESASPLLPHELSQCYPVEEAIIHNQPEMFTYLLSLPFVDINQFHEPDDYTPLFYATNSNHITYIRQLLNHPNLPIWNGSSMTARQHAIANNRPEIATLIDASMHATLPRMLFINNEPVMNALVAARDGETAFIQNIDSLTHDPVVELNQEETNTLHTPLMKAILHCASQAHMDIINYLISNPIVNLNKFNCHGMTALSIAVIANNYLVVDKLLTAGVRLDIGKPYSLALRLGHTDILKRLLRYRPIVNPEDIHTFDINQLQLWDECAAAAPYYVSPPPLMTISAAIQHPLIHINRNAPGVAAPAAENPTPEPVETPVVVAVPAAQTTVERVGMQFLADVRNNRIENVRQYVNTHFHVAAAINVADDNGDTALILACRLGHMEIFNTLVHVPGIDFYAMNHLEHNAAYEAQAAQRDEMATELMMLMSAMEVDPPTPRDAVATVAEVQATSATAMETVEPVIHHNGSFIDRLNACGYDGPIKALFICPISLDIMNDPVALVNGQTFDRESLERLFNVPYPRAAVQCPITRDIITSNVLTYKTHYILKALIEEYVQEIEKQCYAEKAACEMRLSLFKELPFFKKPKPVVSESLMPIMRIA